MSTVAHLSLEQYDRMIAAGVFEPGDGNRLEFIQGEIREMSPIGSLHAEVVARLNEWSFASLPEKAARVFVQSPIGLPGQQSAPEPDLVWAKRRDYSQRRPAGDEVLLLVEVAESSLEFDTGEKAELYATAGIADYWVVDLAARAVEVYRQPLDGRYRSLQTFTGDDEVRPLAFPEVVLRPSALFSSES